MALGGRGLVGRTGLGAWKEVFRDGLEQDSLLSLLKLGWV